MITVFDEISCMGLFQNCKHVDNIRHQYGIWLIIIYSENQNKTV